MENTGTFNEKSVLFREIEHTADVALEAEGPTLESLFAAAAFGLRSLLLEPVPDRRKKTSIKIRLKENSVEALLVRWLSELNFIICTNKYVFEQITEIEIRTTGKFVVLKARLNGSHFGNLQEVFLTEIKAVTFHNLKIRQQKGRFKVQIVFDI